jgi:hypothetical protein
MGFPAHPFRDDLNESYTPPEWTPEHVERLMIEAYITLLALPRERTGPRGHANAWPEYAATFEDLVAQVDSEQPEKRLIYRPRPTPREIAQMETVLAWPIQFLRGYSVEARALCARSLAKAKEMPVKCVARFQGITERQLRNRSHFAARAIAIGLTRNMMPLWSV